MPEVSWDVTEEPSVRSSTRRRHLRNLAGVALCASMTGCSWLEEDTGRATPTKTEGRTVDGRTETDEPTPTRKSRLEDRFESVVDVVEAGADPTGEDPINQLLEDELDDDTVFFFPEGTYHVSGLMVIQSYSNVGIVGPEATLVPTEGQRGYWLIVDDLADLLIEGVTLSNAAEATGVRTRIMVSGGTNLVRNVSVTGFHDVSERTHAFTLQVNGSDTSLVLDRVEMSDGARNGTAIYTHPADDPGTLRLQNCRIENWYVQGLYGSPHGGPLYVVGGRYVNNGEAQIRVGGGGTDTESVIRDVTVRVTDPEPADRKTNIRGIWLKEGEGTLVENCDIEISNLSEYGSSGALVVGPEHGRATIKNTALRVDAPTFALAAPRPKEEDFVIPSLDHPPRNWDVSGENIRITGTASDQVALLLVGRPECSLRNLTIKQVGENRDGLGVIRSPRTVFEQCTCITTGYPLIADFRDAEEGCNIGLTDVGRLESTGLEAASEGESVPENDGRYCIDQSQFELTENRPGIGIVRENEDTLYVQVLPDRHLDPF